MSTYSRATGIWALGQGTLRAFFPVLHEPEMAANRVANKVAYTDGEILRIIDACDNLGEIVWSNGRESGVYTGEDVKDFIWVVVYSGLRISDVGLFNMTRLSGNEIFLRAKKNGGDVFAYIPDWLREALRGLSVRPRSF